MSKDLTGLLEDVEKHWKGYRLDPTSIADEAYIGALNNLFYVYNLRKDLSIVESITGDALGRLRSEQMEELAGG